MRTAGPGDAASRLFLRIGFAGALRRSQLVGLDVATSAPRPTKRARSRKSPYCGARIPQTCPVRALQNVAGTIGLVDGPLVGAVDRPGRIAVGRLTERIVGERLQKIGERSGLDPQSHAAHSLRRGFATLAARANDPKPRSCARDGVGASPVARRYIWAGSRWHDHAGAGFGSNQHSVV